MIEKNYRFYNLICDNCGQAGIDTYDTFDDARIAARELEWETTRDGDGAWINICPECKKEGSA